MKFGRGESAAASKPVALPERSETVTIIPGVGEKLPARVLESAPDAIVVAILVPAARLSPRKLEGLVLEFLSQQGRVRLSGTATIDDPSDPDVVRIARPRSIEVLQEREFVRIRSARPVLVYMGADRTQVQSFTVDISGGGFLLAGPETLRMGDEIQFLLTIVEGEMPVSGTGKVVRVESGGRRGIELTDVTELERRRLVRFIFDCQREELRRGIGTDHHGS